MLNAESIFSLRNSIFVVQNVLFSHISVFKLVTYFCPIVIQVFVLLRVKSIFICVIEGKRVSRRCGRLVCRSVQCVVVIYLCTSGRRWIGQCTVSRSGGRGVRVQTTATNTLHYTTLHVSQPLNYLDQISVHRHPLSTPLSALRFVLARCFILFH